MNYKKTNSYKSFIKSKYLSLKYKNYFNIYDNLFNEYKNKNIFIEIEKKKYKARIEPSALHDPNNLILKK